MGFHPPGVGSTVSTAEIAGASLIVESETITSNDNDTTIPTSAAVKNYADAETATLTNKTIDTASNTITVNEADVQDLGSYITASSADTLTNKTIDANGTGNSITNIETADLAAAAKSGADTTVITGTAGTNGNIGQFNGDGDLVDASIAASDVITPSSTDTFTNKTYDANGTGNSLSNVDVEDLADGTDGELITWGADAAPTTVAAGSSGQILTSNGAGAAPTFQDAASGSTPQYERHFPFEDISAIGSTTNNGGTVALANATAGTVEFKTGTSGSGLANLNIRIDYSGGGNPAFDVFKDNTSLQFIASFTEVASADGFGFCYLADNATDPSSGAVNLSAHMGVFIDNANGTNTAYLSCADGLANQTKTAMSGITTTEYNIYRVHTDTTDVTCYVGETLKATNSSDVPGPSFSNFPQIKTGVMADTSDTGDHKFYLAGVTVKLNS